MLELLRQPWPWYVAGPLIGLIVPFIYWYGGKKWGLSSSLQHLCAATVPSGIEYFRYDWKRQGSWHLAMVTGIVVGGFLGWRVLSRPDHVIAISESSRDRLASLGVQDFSGMMPTDLFSFEALATFPGMILIVGGGFLVGFGARYANGCTSGHAISGLATLQRSSLVAVLGFFAGGLLAAHVLLPWIL
jgi:uncharacterized protein